MELSLKSATAGADAVLRIPQAAPPLQLCSYSSNVFISPAIINSLPAATLTSLSLCLCPETCRSATVVSRLTKLRELRLTGDCRHRFTFSVPDLRGLQQLTNLHMSTVAADSNPQHVPPQLLQLTIHYPVAIGLSGPPMVDLRHLQQLQQLHLSAGMLAAGSALPSQLQDLSVCVGSGSAIAVVHISQLGQLSTLRLMDTNDTAQELFSLANVPKLQHLSLSYDFDIDDDLVSCGVAAAWPKLPQLHSFEISDGYMVPERFPQLIQGIAAVTQLTKLVAFVTLPGEIENQDGVPDQFTVCEWLKGLTGLRELTLQLDGHSSTLSKIPLHDTLHLTALKALTNLSLSGGAPQVDDTVIACLAVELTNLQHLSLVHNNADAAGFGTAALPVVGKLSTLKSFCLQGLPRYSAADATLGLSFLTGLKQLTELSGFDAADAGALAEFWSVVGRQRRP